MIFIYIAPRRATISSQLMSETNTDLILERIEFVVCNGA